MKLKQLVRALSYRNYRLFFSGQIISLIGTWMQQIALSWLIYRLTGSALLLGVVAFTSQIPTFFISPFAGVISDRMNKHKIIVSTQVLSMIQASLLAFLVLTDLITVWQIIVLNILIGVVNGFDIPARQSFIIEMLDKKEDLSNAIALNSSMFNAARLIGPALAGIIIPLVGEGICFLINAVSYVAVIIALLSMKIKPRIFSSDGSNVIKNLKQGLSYAYKFFPIRIILILVALTSLFGMPYTVLMPVFAKNILGGGAETLGFLLGSVGLGAFLGAIYLASRKTVRGLGKVISISSLTFGAALTIFSFSQTLWFSLIILTITGANMMIQMASCNTILQTLTEDNMRGRIMAFYTMSFIGMAPFGSLIAGSMADYVGAPMTLMFGGIVCMIVSVIFSSQLPSLRTLMRPVYIQRGIIPEIATGINTATNLGTPPEN